MHREHEKRLFPRRTTIPVPVTVHWPAKQSDELAGEVLDYAPSGLTVQVERAVPVGSRLGIRPRHEGHTHEIEVRVENCREQDGGWRLGCQFVETQHWDNLRIFS